MLREALGSIGKLVRATGGRAAIVLLVLVLVAGGGGIGPVAQAGLGLPPPAWPPDGPEDAQSTTGPVPPPGVNSAGLERLAPTAAIIIPGVPAYIWHHGCGPTAAGMVIGYWDGKAFADLVPGDASTQTAAVNEMIASEGAASNYTDYCLPLDYSPSPRLPDLSELPVGDEHADECVADYMKTSQSYHSNYYGWSWYSTVGLALVGYARQQLGEDVPLIAYANVTVAGGLNWDVYRAMIDRGWPMVLLVDTDGNGGTDHFITAVGYEEVFGIPHYIAFNTWDTSLHWYEFRSMGAGKPWGIYGATAFRIALRTYLPAISRMY